MKAINLLCEYSSNPLGLDEKKPRFSWEVKANKGTYFQSAYQILVASSKEIIEEDKADIWDSGKVETKKSVNNEFEGSNLKSGQKYYWKAKLWDEEGLAGKFSNVATFEMELLNSEGWEGYWITYSDNVKGPLFRKEFNVEKDVEKARAYVTGLGYYELRLNGEKVGEEVLDPGWTDYNKRILYTTQDITEGLKKGKNAVGMMLGNGRYSPDKKIMERNPKHNALRYGDKSVALLQIEIEFTDGSKISVVTDNTWKVTSGPITYNDIYGGEVYDARLEKEGWDLPEFDDSEWEPAIKADPQPGGKIVSQATFPPIKICETLRPEKITSPKPGVYIYDFGQNFTGWVRFKGKAAEGTEVKIRYAELLADDGMLNTLVNRSADATDVYIFKGEGGEVYEPRFTYHGFRYVEVTGDPGTPSLENIKGRVVHTAVAKTGNFYCDNDLINKIHNNILWSQASNLMSIPTDCPQRDERHGWMGDAQLVAEEAVYNFNMVGLYRKWLADIRDAQLEDGSVPEVVPPYWSIYPAGTAWGSACVLIPWYVYLFYNDLRILEKNYDMMKKWVDFLEENADDNILQKLAKQGDWCSPWHTQAVDTSLELISTWYYYYVTLVFSKIAAILGKEDISEKYEARAAKIKDAFNEIFLAEDCYSGGRQYEWYEGMVPENASEEEKERRRKRLRGIYGVGSQTSNILPLYLNMVPEEKREQVKDTLLRDIQVVHSNHLNTGIIGTRYIMDVLTDIGYCELAYKLVTQTTYPSWGYMIKEGATTIWERWEYLAGAGMNSHNHIMLGTVDSWFYKALAGINLDLSSKGFEEIVIKPILLDGMNSAAASLNTVRGVISSRWSKYRDSLTLEVVIPGNCMARVYVPVLDDADDFVISESEDENNIWLNGSFEEKEGIVSGNREGDYVVFTVKPGSFKFVCKNK